MSSQRVKIKEWIIIKLIADRKIEETNRNQRIRGQISSLHAKGYIKCKWNKDAN